MGANFSKDQRGVEENHHPLVPLIKPHPLHRKSIDNIQPYDSCISLNAPDIIEEREESRERILGFSFSDRQWLHDIWTQTDLDSNELTVQFYVNQAACLPEAHKFFQKPGSMDHLINKCILDDRVLCHIKCMLHFHMKFLSTLEDKITFASDMIYISEQHASRRVTKEMILKHNLILLNLMCAKYPEAIDDAHRLILKAYFKVIIEALFNYKKAMEHFKLARKSFPSDYGWSSNIPVNNWCNHANRLRSLTFPVQETDAAPENLQDDKQDQQVGNPENHQRKQLESKQTAPPGCQCESQLQDQFDHGKDKEEGAYHFQHSPVFYKTKEKNMLL